MHTFFSRLQPTLHISHRGGSALAPENTLTAFERAVREFKTQMLELDVHLTRDGELVVAHDPTLERCTNGHGEISGHTLAELQALDAGYFFTRNGGASFPFRGQGVRLPSLRELLRAFPALPLNIEVKAEAPGVEDAFAKLLVSENAMGRVCIGSEHDALAAKLVEALPDACHFYPRDALVALVMGVKLGGEVVEDPRYTVLDMPDEYQGVPLIDADFLARMKAMGRWVNVWTIDEPERMRELKALGVGGIMTDRPDLLREVLDEA